jgi:DNA primase catalytic core
MARFDDELIRRLKEETDIVRLIESYGTKLKERPGTAGEMIGLCPIHEDHQPSLVVNRQKNVWNCLGACGKGGDVIQWVMHAERASFRHAVELLQNGATGTGGGRKFTTERKLECPLATDADNAALLTSVVDYYHERLKQSPQALDYLQSRGITSSEAIDTFKIGFVDRTLGLRLPFKSVKAGSEIRERLKRIGILREKSGHEHLRGCVVFPLLGEVGQVVQLYGRRVDNGQRESGKHFYLPRPHQGIFNRAAFMACDELILCESIIDALTFWNAGYRNVTTIYGTNGLTDELLEALKQHAIRRLLLAFDNDRAGNDAAAKHAEVFTSLGIELFRVKFPAGQDANQYALKLQPAAKALDLVIRSAEWLGQGKPPTAPTSLEAAKKENAAADVSRNALAAGSSGAEEAPAASAVPLTEIQPPAASPLPRQSADIEAEIADNGIVITLGNRTYRVRGLERNLAFDVLKLNVMVRRDERFYVDTFDLYAARARGVFIKEAAQELGFDPEVIKRDLGKVLLKLESLQDKQIEQALSAKDETIELSDKDKTAALELLKQPNLIERILADFDACGVVGEETNKLVGYLAATSRKLDKPLAVVIQSSSAAGKSSLMDAVLRFIPPEAQVGYSAMTGQSLFYMGGMDLRHKILSIAEEEGVAQASYALKLLQSEGQLTIASTGKDPGTGRMETQEYHVEGPVMIFLTTTAIDIDEELLNRCIVLTVDENREQTRAIHDQQRRNETLDGLLRGKRSSSIRKLHQNAQRLIRPLLVVNPFADQLRFCDDQARRRRDHMKYLALIRSIALLHQYQRPIKQVAIDDETVPYVEVIASDIVLANRLADQVLGKSIDELPPQTRRLLLELHAWIMQECERLKVDRREHHFTRRMVRESLGWSQTALKKHLDRLIEMEFVIPHRGSGRRVEYELVYDGRGREGQPTMCGLIDAATLPGVAKSTTTNTASSPLERASSLLELESSPQDHPENTLSSPPSNNGKPQQSNTLPR